MQGAVQGQHRIGLKVDPAFIILIESESDSEFVCPSVRQPLPMQRNTSKS